MFVLVMHCQHIPLTYISADTHQPWVDLLSCVTIQPDKRSINEPRYMFPKIRKIYLGYVELAL